MLKKLRLLQQQKERWNHNQDIMSETNSIRARSAPWPGVVLYAER